MTGKYNPVIHHVGPRFQKHAVCFLGCETKYIEIIKTYAGRIELKGNRRSTLINDGAAPVNDLREGNYLAAQQSHVFGNKAEAAYKQGNTGQPYGIRGNTGRRGKYYFIEIRVFNHGDITGIGLDRKSTRLNSSHVKISYAVFCLKKKNNK